MVHRILGLLDFGSLKQIEQDEEEIDAKEGLGQHEF